MNRIIQSIQVKNLKVSPQLFKAVIIYSPDPKSYGDNYDIEKQEKIIHKLMNDGRCIACEEMERKRRNIDGWER
ncbi:MAG: hypothetical protein CMH79_04320 [Nitrospinae bacterium]|nr:hypothetical protein [Nitrospinota bacterium]